MEHSGGIGGLSVPEEKLLDSGLDPFQAIPVESSMVDGKNVVYRPIASINNSGPYEFVIPKVSFLFKNEIL